MYKQTHDLFDFVIDFLGGWQLVAKAHHHQFIWSNRNNN